jgi:hypothetical protein
MRVSPASRRARLKRDDGTEHGAAQERLQQRHVERLARQVAGAVLRRKERSGMRPGRDVQVA